MGICFVRWNKQVGKKCACEKNLPIILARNGEKSNNKMLKCAQKIV